MIFALVSCLVFSPVLIDRVVGVVDKEVITESEVLLEARLALAYRDGAQAAEKPLSEQFVMDFLGGYLVYQRLLGIQARRLGIEVSDADVDRERHYLVQQFPSVVEYDNFLQRYDISEKLVVDILRRGLQNGRYLLKRLGSRFLGARIIFTWPKDNPVLRHLLEELWQNSEIRLRQMDELQRQEQPLLGFEFQ